jgi:hypothetical protein
VRRVVSTTLWLALVAGAGCKFDRIDRADHHYAQPPPHQYLPCKAPHVSAEQKTTAPGYPGLVLTEEWYGGSSSWTHEGRPPAGDRCPPVPPGVTPRMGATGEKLSAR